MAYYVRVGNRMMELHDYKDLSEEKTKQLQQDAIDAANKRKEAIEKALNPKKKEPVIFDVRPEALAKAEVEATSDPVVVDTVSETPEVQNEESESAVEAPEKKKAGRPPKVAKEAAEAAQE